MSFRQPFAGMELISFSRGKNMPCFHLYLQRGRFQMRTFSRMSWVNLLKLRASYGKTGQDNLGSSLYGVYEPSGFKVGFSDNSIFYVPLCVNGNKLS